MEIKCCEIALAAIIVNLISLLLFFGYSIKANKGDSGFSFSSDKKALPIVWKDFQTNYNKKNEEKILHLEEMVKKLQEQLKKYDKSE